MAKKPEKTSDNNDKLEGIMKDLNKKFGDSIRRGVVGGKISLCEAISTRCLALDIALGIGGIPKGRITEIFGPESSGKTTLALTAVAEVQSKGGLAAYIDVEHAVDVHYAQQIGVNLDNLIFSQPNSGEEALGIVEDLIDTGEIDLIVVDSVAALVTIVELEGEMTDANIGAQAKLMSKALRKINGKLRKTTLIFINQLREKVGIVGFGASNEITSGGKALKFYASVRLDIRKIGTVSKSDKTKIANETRVRVIKNKVAPPLREAVFQITFGKGISAASSIIDEGLKYEIIEKSAATLSYNGLRLGLGLQDAINFLESNKGIAEEIKGKVLAIIAERNAAAISEIEGPREVEEPPEDIEMEDK